MHILRVDVKDMSLIDEELLRKSDSMGIMKPSGTHIHVVYGSKIDKVAKSVKDAMRI